MIVRADQTAEKPVRRDTLAKGVGRIPAEYAGGAEVRPWVEGHSDPPGLRLISSRWDFIHCSKTDNMVNKINLGTAGCGPASPVV